MKARDSGMPDDTHWSTFFVPEAAIAHPVDGRLTHSRYRFPALSADAYTPHAGEAARESLRLLKMCQA